MAVSSFINQHIMGSVCASFAEANGYEAEAKRLHAQTKLRLLMMSDREIEELARVTAYLPDRPMEIAIAEIQQAIEEYRTTSEAWLPDVYGAADCRGSELNTTLRSFDDPGDF